MDTKPLERFATKARRELIAAVEAQAAVVLAADSVARSERAGTVKRLEAEIAAHGQKHVIDKVAYTWFNRLIALRYMDARGYTSAGVVSPAQGHAHGQPEILADAKRGHLADEVVINARTRQAVMGLLNAPARSTDAEGEAYALLLTEYCRFWNKAMPFMFEREGDYTELLVPSDLLADGAILSRAREVLTEDVCKDVEVIGWLYQFYISERKDEVFAGFKKNKKAGADEIPAATQLFTPHWIVRYLVENSLGRLWMLNRPASRLVDQMDYYITPVDEEPAFLKIRRSGRTDSDRPCLWLGPHAHLRLRLAIRDLRRGGARAGRDSKPHPRSQPARYRDRPACRGTSRVRADDEGTCQRPSVPAPRSRAADLRD